MNRVKRAKFRVGRIKRLITENIHNDDLIIDVDHKLGDILEFINEETKRNNK